MDTSIATTLIASSSAIGGILIKMMYDYTSAHIDSRRTNANRFLSDRKTAYDSFWSSHKEVVDGAYRLHDLTLIARAGKDVKHDVIENFPPSAMGDLVAALEDIRRVARTREIVEICERIVALHGDASSALRHFLHNDDVTYGLPFFLANRLREDQEREFTLAYRNGLGIGLPERVGKDWLTVSRPWPSAEMEEMLRMYVKNSKRSFSHENANDRSPKVLTKEDIKLIDSPKFQAMILSNNLPSEEFS